jgi:UDP-N-acetylglucosamine 3-dehydrogenase
MADLKAAVVGVGSMGRNHARIYQDLPETRLVAVVDVSETRRTQVAARHGCRHYDSLEEMLALESPDLVSIVVPTVAHFGAASMALRAGCHVLVEKPVAATEAEAHALIDLATRLDRCLMVGHIVRFDPAIQALREHLRQGELGRLFEVKSRRLGPFPNRIQDVGVIVDLATHDLDIACFLTGQPITRVYCETARRLHSGHEDMLVGTLRHADGTMGLLDINWLTPNKVRELSVTGERGMFVVNYLTQDLYLYENEDAQIIEWDRMAMLKGVSEGRMIRYALKKAEPLKLELAAFVGAVLRGEPPLVSGEDGLAALTAALALVRSGEEHRAIEIAPFGIPVA